LACAAKLKPIIQLIDDALISKGAFQSLDLLHRLAIRTPCALFFTPEAQIATSTAANVSDARCIAVSL
jgi:hypothetical protein